MRKFSISRRVVALCLVLAWGLLATSCGQQTTVDSSGSEDSSGTSLASQAVTEASEQTGDTTQLSTSDTVGSQSTRTTKTTANKSGTANGPSAAFIQSLKGVQISYYTQRSEKPQRGTSSGDRYYSILSKVGAKYGASISVYTGDSSAIMPSILAGKPVVNVQSLQDVNLSAFLRANGASPLNNAMAQSGVTFEEEWYNQDIRKFMNISNQQYGWTTGINEPYFIFYNKRLVSQAGLADPYSLYEKGQWDFSKFEEYCAKLTQKATDGSVIVAACKAADWVTYIRSLVPQNGGNIVTFSNGKMTYGMDSQKSINALQFFRDMKTNGYFQIGATWQAGYVDFTKGKSAMVIGTKYTVAAINDNSMTDAVGLVPMPSGPDAAGDKTIYYDQVFVDCIVKPAEADAAKILYLMNEVNSELYKNREQDFYDDYRTIIRDDKAYNIFEQASFSSTTSNIRYTMLGGARSPLDAFVVSLGNGSTSVAQAVTSLKSSFQSELDKNWSSVKFTG